ncbi:MAG TPA: choice-of-anchor J domain-containing protein [Candidatus Barnesiella merdigallinarum]|nr:choice-of-anchor J domain-containing protein [Candidatus Barnesiella merdigallinarum]
MRKFAWIFMAAMTVAGFSACSNSDDDVLPGLGGGGNGGGPTTTPSVVITDTIYQFNNIEADYTPINELCPGWTHEIVSPVDDDRTWQSKTFNNSTAGVTEKYIQATAHDSSDKNAGKTYELWMISPALNVKDAANKVFSFYSEGAYWQSTSSLEVYVLNEPKSTASSKEKLNVTLATSTNPGGNFKGWVASGDISLEGKGDIVYVGFRYQAQGGNKNSTTYCIDDFAFGRAQVEHFLGESGGEEPEPTPDVDWSKAISVADALAQADQSTFAVKGHIVGCIKNNPSKTFYESFAEAQAAGDIEWAGAAAFTGYSQVFIADDAAETDGTKCILVKLNDTDAAKALRNEAKLEGNPDRIGMTIYVQGLKKANYGLPGIREISAYKVGE